MIKDLDVVALTRDLTEHGLKAGDVGAVVHVYQDGVTYEVEFVAFDGKTMALVTLPTDAIRPMRAREIPNARQVA
jgi:hypothetical protein